MVQSYDSKGKERKPKNGNGGEDGLGRGKEQHDRHVVPCSATLSAKVCPSAVDCNGLNLSYVWSYANRRRKRGRVVSRGGAAARGGCNGPPEVGLGMVC